MKLYRKIRHRKGFGIHSPFVYNLITKVIEEKYSFYAYTEIENFRKQLLAGNDETSRITAHETQRPAYGALLFRIVNFFNCRNVIHIGASTGVLSLYLSMAIRTQGRCYLLEKRAGLLCRLKDYAARHNLQKLYYIEGSEAETLPTFRTLFPEADLIFVNRCDRLDELEQALPFCRPSAERSPVLILNNIAKSREMKQLWQKVKELPSARICIDLCALGIVFFNHKLPKRQYKLFFNHEKKESVHPKRR
ncbi:MAG: hypothetical protein LBH61_03880 [Dysgonamonadaceae bacterium]|jgi:predicted O-methyltransferase YrrM|nr:hypothetical protein [Dysgonamonadaceae bacterium]